MNEYTDAYIEFIADKLTPYAELFIEAKLDYSRWVKEGFGTVDCVIVSDDRLEIIDFKYGKGHLGDAYENPQMMLYALRAI